MTIKTGDNVVVIAGKDKGKSGKVTAVYADANKVLVENVNIVSKHQKPKSQQDKGGIFKRPAPIEASNVMVVCPVCGKATRVAHTEINGKKVRTCKKCGASLDKEYVKQTKKEAKKAIKASDLKNAKLKVAGVKKSEEKVEEAEEVKKTTKKAASTKSTKKVADKKVEVEEKAEPKKATTTKKTATAKKETAVKENKEKATTKKTTAKKSTTVKETK